jgi:hypothetical protein
MDQMFFNYAILALMILAGFVAGYGLVNYFVQEFRIKWIYPPSGACPVQAEGYFMGKYFYFRSRWETARIEFADSEEAWDDSKIDKTYILYKTYGYAAGWIPHWKARLLIYKGCMMYLFKMKSNA